MSEFDAFFLANYQLVVATAEYRLSSMADAEEAAAAAFRVAWQHHEAGGELSVPWLYRVVRNLIGNEYRRRKRQTALEGRIAELAPVPDSDGTDHAEQVRAAVEALPPQHRDVIKMAYWDDLTPGEIGEVLGLTAGAVSTRLFRARRACARLLHRSIRELNADGR